MTTTTIPHAFDSTSFARLLQNELARDQLNVLRAPGTGYPASPFVIVRTVGRTEPSRGFRRRALVFVVGLDVTVSDPDDGLEQRLNAVLVNLDANGHLIVGTTHIPLYDPSGTGTSKRRFPAIAIDVEEAS